MHGKFYSELDIEWDPKKLINIMMSYPGHMWKAEPGISNRYLRVDDPYIDSLITQLCGIGYDVRNKFFAEMKGLSALPIHTDLSRSNAVNFPLIGDWKNSPINFYDTQRQLAESYCYRPGKAVWINTQVPHNVVNNAPTMRFILSISIYNDLEEPSAS